MTKRVRYSVWTDVTVNERKFTKAFMKAFNEGEALNFKTVDDHIKHIGELVASGRFTPNGGGYLDVYNLGIKTNRVSSYTESWDIVQ